MFLNAQNDRKTVPKLEQILRIEPEGSFFKLVYPDPYPSVCIFILEIDGLNRFGSEDSKSTIFRVRLYEALEASIFGVSKNPGYPVKVEVQENGFLC